MGVLAWLMASRIGQYLSMAVAIFTTVVGVYLYGRSAGENACENSHNKQSADNLRERSKTHDNVIKMPASKRRDALREWVSDD